MSDFDWSLDRGILKDFGGVPITLFVDKTGLPFYDALRLYGAIDLYIGTREDISIRDCGDHWAVSGRTRMDRVRGRDIAAFRSVCTKRRPAADEFCIKLRHAITSGKRMNQHEDPDEAVPSDERGRALDPVLQSGIRGLSAADYESMNSTSRSECKAKVPLSDAVIAYAGLRRTEGVGDFQFLPIFEGLIDLGKIVSPLRAWASVPNPLCARTLMLLSLKTALWSEGYGDRLSAVAYSKKQRQSFNYSGVIRIESTAIGQIEDGEFCFALYRVFSRMVRSSWSNQKATSMAFHTLSVAEWLMQPSPKTLGPMICAQEFLLKSGNLPFLIVANNVREVFQVTYPQRKIDYNAVCQLAKTVSSAIYTLGPKDDANKRRQHWYNEVVTLRNTPNRESFRHRVLTLIERGRAENSWVERFDPASLLDSMGQDRTGFEEFRDCFRMYLIQESAPKGKTTEDVGGDTNGAAEVGQEGEEGAQ